ncbi:hypothetical protein QAD02_009598 [Eretmocerus hayati]|uniref:Uncharacterized protein n=1 Tax=Eretmocerus hayati TaxID=131215 RepID=A0ACC2NE91_9HYME|nr:hypothetical protein QAD02_009598 [Eretmocerus hayati]
MYETMTLSHKVAPLRIPFTSHVGLRVIDKQPYKPPRGTTPPPPDQPNYGLIDLLIKDFDPRIHTLSEESLIHATTAESGTYLYCYNVGFDDLAPDFVGYLYQDQVIRASNIDPSKN